MAEHVVPARIRLARRLAVVPRLGDTIGLLMHPTFYVVDKYLQHGPVLTIKTPYQTYTVLAGVDAAAFMGSREGRECLSVGNAWRPVEQEFGGEHSLITVDGPRHREWRRTLQRGYSREAIKDRYAEAVAIIDDAIDNHWSPGARVRVLPAMQTLSIAQVGVFAGGERPSDADIQDVAHVTNQLLKIAPVQHIPKVVLRRRRYVRTRARVTELAEQAIARAHIKGGDGAKSTLIDDIVTSVDADPAQRPNMIFNAVMPYLAGVETTSSTATYALYLILKHPDVLARIRDEVDDLFSSGEINHDRLFGHTPTLEGAILEAMRLYPIASFIIRVAAKDFEFKGRRIRRGDKVFVGTAVPHFLDECYAEPMRFDVDRYRAPHAQHRAPGAYSPFGRGPHLCIGKALAEAMMQITLARLLYRLDLRLRSPSYRIRNRIAHSAPSGRFAVDVIGLRN